MQVIYAYEVSIDAIYRGNAPEIDADARGKGEDLGLKDTADLQFMVVALPCKF